MADSISITKHEKEQKSLPKGAKVLSKTTNTRVEEIENGFLLVKETDYRYETGTGDKRSTDWMSITKKWYSEEDPVKITVNDTSLADSFDEE